MARVFDSDGEWYSHLKVYKTELEDDIVVANPIRIYGEKLVSRDGSIAYWFLCRGVNIGKRAKWSGPIMHAIFDEDEYRKIKGRIEGGENPIKVFSEFGEPSRFAYRLSL